MQGAEGEAVQGRGRRGGGGAGEEGGRSSPPPPGAAPMPAPPAALGPPAPRAAPPAALGLGPGPLPPPPAPGGWPAMDGAFPAKPGEGFDDDEGAGRKGFRGTAENAKTKICMRCAPRRRAGGPAPGPRGPGPRGRGPRGRARAWAGMAGWQGDGAGPGRWKNGHCRFGERCNFAHGEEELRKLPPRGEVDGGYPPRPGPGGGGGPPQQRFAPPDAGAYGGMAFADAYGALPAARGAPVRPRPPGPPRPHPPPSTRPRDASGLGRPSSVASIAARQADGPYCVACIATRRAGRALGPALARLPWPALFSLHAGVSASRTLASMHQQCARLRVAGVHGHVPEASLRGSVTTVIGPARVLSTCATQSPQAGCAA